MIHDLSKILQLEPKFQEIIDTYGNPTITIRASGFIALSQLILEQQVSIASAKACYDKIENYLNGFTPQLILQTSDEELKACGVSRQKISYIKNLARSIEKNKIDLESFHSKTETEVYNELIQLKGIGKWTAQVYLMFCLQKKDVFPIGDIAVQHTMRELFQTESLEEMELHATNWKPYRSLATYLLWHHYLKKRNR
ncbi:DNA-3-methyladenine glycosylase 2 family protein [Flavobacterium sp. 20NA77.7]|uniref:DNA-3-methyladenine glycosylase II n=1 Tax=Flavobacterium nakdongensis TaxID=3073563 RepID=A0ABY9R8F6_9FLAO|nr:DNA-3-methyladenine glycosylase 2 family protein [Flavobacterium sp. 20NA77.7]WMW77542.1 DNA-3-methyladenine glycosylase 2 family protein [Flavobacterium sp. 20NA77.7]